MDLQLSTSLTSAYRSNEVLAREGIDTIWLSHARYKPVHPGSNEVLAREGIDTY